MTNTKLNLAIRALAEEFAEGVIRAIVALPLRRLASITDGERSGSIPRSRSVARPSQTKRTTQAHAQVPKKGASSTKPLSAEILSVLKRTKEWMTSEEIKRELKRVPARNTVFLALRALQDDDLVAKRGTTRSMAYQVTRKGLDTRT